MAPNSPKRHPMVAPEDYFRGVSPMCRRILDEMSAVRESFGSEWNNLSYEEQCRILDQTIVDEATVRRYEHDGKPQQLDCVYFPKLKMETGQKIVSDEKLSARGYSCSWRDEHSAPFSWHTRSQMDLTLDTPPPTPTSNANITPISSKDIADNLKKPIPKNYSLNSIREVSTFKTPAFLWHYDPTPDTRPPDPPELVIGSSFSPLTSSSDQLLSRSTSFNHLVVRDDSKAQGLLDWIRGAASFIAGPCLPIQMCIRDSKSRLHRGSSPLMHPELRPLHVIAKAANVTPSTQPSSSAVSSGMKSPSSKDSTLRVESSSVDTSTTTCDVHSDADSDVKSRKSWSEKRSNPANRHSSLYSVSASPIEESEDEETSEQITVKENVSSIHRRRRSQMTPEAEDSEPLILDDADIPKTGFDFLDNW